jgi:hypothetical protein
MLHANIQRSRQRFVVKLSLLISRTAALPQSAPRHPGDAADERVAETPRQE